MGMGCGGGGEVPRGMCIRIREQLEATTPELPGATSIYIRPAEQDDHEGTESAAIPLRDQHFWVGRLLVKKYIINVTRQGTIPPTGT